MMRGATFFSNLLFLLLLGSFVFGNEARMVKPHNSVEMDITKVLDDLHVEAVKTGGEGHATTNGALTLEGIKKSGPSPGAGN
ncbi:hypothetical protein AAHA92_23455 [Salvia divinorum]|uniref:Uncharacterized protein n=1 Tax=Salvia divinorum TaxID=28513 RepID=A0ABD1GS35_SALDI